MLLGRSVTGFGATVAMVLVGCGGNAVSIVGEGNDSGLQDAATDTGPGDRDAGNLDAGHPDGSALDSGAPDAGPWSPSCPASAPSPGEPCTQDNLECEYGNAWWNIGCDVVVQCQSGKWTTYPVPGGGGGSCSPPGPNSGACPGDLASISSGSTCPSSGLQCVYPQGMCTCETPFTGPPPQQDGGGPGATWQCVPFSGCPWPRPRVGTACTGTGYCTYVECELGESCQGGVWQASLEACAE